jgi:TPR repeat protein
MKKFLLFLTVFFCSHAYAQMSIGVTLQNIDGGVLITDVAENGPAYKEGLMKKDIVYAIEGKKIYKTEDFIEIVKSSSGATPLTFEFLRGSIQKIIKIKPIDVDINSYSLGSSFYEKGFSAYKEKKYKEAVSWYEKAADRGHVYAWTILGAMYLTGDGVPRNYEKAYYWSEKAAVKGVAEAQNNLGVLYQHGAGVSQNYDTAKYWYQQALENGYSKASEQIVNIDRLKKFKSQDLYIDGVEAYGEKDYVKALSLYKQSAELGYMSSQYSLASMYDRGLGTERDIDKATYWYEKAADQGSENAAARLKKLNSAGYRFGYAAGNAIEDGIGYLGKKMDEGIEYVKENPEESLAMAAAVVGAVLVGKSLSEDRCLRSHNNCSSAQEAHHEKVYNRVNGHFSGLSSSQRRKHCVGHSSFSRYLASIGLTLVGTAIGDGDLFSLGAGNSDLAAGTVDIYKLLCDID